MAKKKLTLEEKMEEAIILKEKDVIPKNWIAVSLNSIVTFEKGKKPKTLIETKEENAIPYVTIKYFQTMEADQYTFITETNRICEEEDILIVWDGARAGLIGSGVSGALGSTLCKIKFKKMEQRYMYYYFIGKYDSINANTKGTGIPHVDPNYLKDLEIGIPPLKEQERIVNKIESLFEKLDKAKELIEEAREGFENRKAAILDKAFRGELTKNHRYENGDLIGKDYLNNIAKLRDDKYNELLKMSKLNNYKKPKKPHKIDLEFEQMSEGWIKTKLYNLIYDFKYGTSLKSDYENEGKPVIRIPNLDNGYINHSDMKYLKEEDIDDNNKVDVGDIVIIRSNGSPLLVGKTSIITEVERDFAFASYLIRIRGIGIEPKYLYYVLNSNMVRSQFLSKSKSTSGINNINTEELGSSIIPVPTTSEQRKIVGILEGLLEEEEKIYELVKLEQQIELIKKSILAKAFRGELGTNDPEEESAMELLKEILSEK